MKRLIALDIDGTTLHSDHTLSKNTVDLLKSLHQFDVEWMFATGRSFEMVQPILDKYGLVCDLLLNNGHEYLSSDRSVHTFHPMRFDLFIFIMEILVKYDFHISIHTAKGKYILTDLDTYFDKHISLNHLSKEEIESRFSDCPVFNKDLFLANTHYVSDYRLLSDTPILKLDTKVASPDNLQQALVELSACCELELSSSYGQYMEVCQNNYDKGKALCDVTGLKNIEADNVYVFGDGLNDIGLFDSFKNSFAPSNAKDAILSKAHHIIPTTDEDGVYATIKSLLDSNFTAFK